MLTPEQEALKAVLEAESEFHLFEITRIWKILKEMEKPPEVVPPPKTYAMNEIVDMTGMAAHAIHARLQRAGVKPMRTKKSYREYLYDDVMAIFRDEISAESPPMTRA